MGLRLHTVAPRQGWTWIRKGFALWWRKPLAFVGLFMFFLFSVMLLMVAVPVLGGPLGMAMLPLLSLGFMVASRSAQAGGPVHGLQLIAGLRAPDAKQRRALWMLCGAYAVASMVVISLSDWVDGGLFETLQRLIAQGSTDGKPTPELDAVLANPRLTQGMLVRVGLAGLLAVPFWFAPALVFWGGQGALQAVFTSTLALWRARGAFTVYLLAWAGLMVAAAAVVMLVGLATGARQALGLLTMPLGLAFSAAFYVSLCFSFDDCFGEQQETPASSTTP